MQMCASHNDFLDCWCHLRTATIFSLHLMHLILTYLSLHRIHKHLCCHILPFYQCIVLCSVACFLLFVRLLPKDRLRWLINETEKNVPVTSDLVLHPASRSFLVIGHLGVSMQTQFGCFVACSICMASKADLLWSEPEMALPFSFCNLQSHAGSFG